MPCFFNNLYIILLNYIKFFFNVIHLFNNFIMDTHYFIINFVVMIDNSQNAEKDVVATISIDTASIEQETKPKEMMSPRTIERMRRADFLGNGPLVKTIWKMTYPDFIAKIVSSLYSLIDSVFIGQYAGSTVEEKKNSLAGVSLASPIEMCIIVALSLIFAQGGGPLYGRYLGKKDIKTSRRRCKTDRGDRKPVT